MFGKKQTETVILKVEGMSCGHCAKHVTDALEAVKGVKKAEVNLEEKKACVIFDAAKTDKSRLVEAVTAAGYRAE